MIQVYCFDFDGTLVDSNDVKRATLMHMVGHLDGAPAYVETLYDQYPPLDRYGIFAAVAKRYNLDAEAHQSLLADFGDAVNSRVVATPWLPGAKVMLQRLHGAGKTLYVNSATPEKDLLSITHDRGMQGYFNGIYGRPASKVENLARTAKDAGCAPAEMIMVGDGADDQQAALDFGCRFQAVFAFRGTRHADMPVLDDLTDFIAE